MTIQAATVTNHTADLPAEGVDQATVTTLDLNGLVIKAGIYTDDTPQATQTLAVWVETGASGVDLDRQAAERMLAALPVFAERVRALTDGLAGGAR